jgi:hypothetical protein
MMKTVAKRSIQSIAVSIMTVTLGLAMPAAAGDRAPHHRSHHQDHEWAPEYSPDRLFRQVLKTFLTVPDRWDRAPAPAWKHHPKKVYRSQWGRGYGETYVCRVKRTVITDHYGRSKQIVREDCRETPPRRRHRHR